MKQKQMQSDTKYITSRELQELLKVSKKFVQKHMASRRLPGMVRIGKMWRFNLEEVEKQLAKGELLLPKDKYE
jgi:excisionase family DNA binding protein